MAAAPRRSPIWTYLVMAAVAGTVIAGVTLIAEPGRPSQPDRAIGLDAGTTLVRPAPTPSLERDFLTAVLGSPRVGRGRPYCDAGGCCSGRRLPPTRWSRPSRSRGTSRRPGIAASCAVGHGRRSSGRVSSTMRAAGSGDASRSLAVGTWIDPPGRRCSCRARSRAARTDRSGLDDRVIPRRWRRRASASRSRRTLPT